MSDGRPWTFADYKIRDILDVDLVSTTYRATTIDGDVRRLRVFTAEVASDERADAHAAVIAEARQARRVRHPHILATHDAGQNTDRVYVVSDDINGAVLRDFIAQRQPLEPSTALAMGWQLAEALDAVHASGNVHGSINPHTIWVADSPGSDVPMTYLTGFGSAQALAQYIKNQDGAPVCDDLLYVGPDQIRDQRPSPEADRYALACAVYHLMAGAPPYRRGSINALFGAHLFAAIEPPTEVRGDLPPALDSVFLRALAKQTSDRYPSAYALMIAAERALRGQREQAAPTQREQAAPTPRARAAEVLAASASPAAGAEVDETPDETADDNPDDIPDETTDDTADETAVAGAGDPPPRPDHGRSWPRPSTALRATDDSSETWVPRRKRPEMVTGPALTPAPPASANGEAIVAATVAGRRDGTGTLDETDRLTGRLDDTDRLTDAVAETVADEEASAPETTAPESTAAPGSIAGDTTAAPESAAADVDARAGDAAPAEDPAPAESNGTRTLGEPRMREGTGTLGAAGLENGTERTADETAGTGGLARRIEARRASRDQPGDAHPSRTLPPPRPPATPPSRPLAAPPSRPPAAPHETAPPAPQPAARFQGLEPAKLWVSARQLLETRRGVVMLVAGALVIAVIATVAVTALRDGTGEAGTQAVAAGEADGDSQPDRDTRPATIRPRWTTPFGSQPVGFIQASDDAVLVAAGTTVGALDPESGAQLWSHRTLADVADVEVLLDLMVVCTRNRISAYDTTTGALRWTRTGEVANVDALVASREHLYAVARDASGIVVSDIDPADGRVASLTTIADDGASGRAGRVTVGVDPSAKKGGPTLYVLSRAALYALEPHDGSVRWSAPATDGGGQDGEDPHLPARPWVDSFGVAPGSSFVVGRDGSVCRYAGDSGELVWSACEQFPSELIRAPALDARGSRVLVSSDDAVAAYDFTNGKLLWSQDQPPLAAASGPELAYVAREDGQVQAVDGASGRVQWQARDIGDVTVLMADADGVYVGAADGSVVRLLERNVAKVDVQ